MNPYKCENHKLNICCLGCISVWIARHDRLLECVKFLYNKTDHYYEKAYLLEVLNEIGWYENED
jgi:hypothetical protein